MNSTVARMKPLFGAVAVAATLCCGPIAKAQTEWGTGQPPAGARQSVPDIAPQLAYQRAFEATLWAMPAVVIYRFRVALLELVNEQIALPSNVGSCAGFRMPAVNDRAICAVAGVRKPPKNEPAGDVGGRCRVLGYGDLGDAEGGCDGPQSARARVIIRLVGGKSWC